MDIYNLIIPHIEKEAFGFDRYRVIISIESLLRAFAEYNNTSYEEEADKFNKILSNEYNVKELELNEFDEYEEIK